MRRSSRGLAVSAALALAGALLAPGLAAAAAPNVPSGATGSATIAFASNTIPLGVASPIAVTLSEQGSFFGGIALMTTISLPGGFTVASPLNASGCSAFTGSAGDTSFNVVLQVGASHATCTETVYVVASTPGRATVSMFGADPINSVSVSASTWVDVVAPATIGAAFGASTLEVGGSTSLTFTIANPNSAVLPGLAGRAAPNLIEPGALSGVGFVDTLPTGLVVATVSGLSSTCGGTASASAGGGHVSLVGGGLATGASCKVIVNVTAVTAGTKQDSTGPVSSTEGGNGAAASTSLTVTKAQPTIATSLSTNSGQPGVSVSDSATLSGAAPGAAGTVTYAVYRDDACAGAVYKSSAVNVTGGVVPSSASLTLDSAGTYYWVATYSGDTNNLGATSVCGAAVVVVRIEPAPSMTLVKSALEDHFSKAGDAIHYRYKLTNTGNVPLTNLGVSDDKVSVDCSGAPASLAPGASYTCVSTYTVLAADVSAKSITNKATGTADYDDSAAPSVDPAATIAVSTGVQTLVLPFEAVEGVQATPLPTQPAAPAPTAITPAVTLPPTSAATLPSGPVGPSGELILLGLSLGLVAAWFAIGCRRQVRRS
jgi:hypothetical protein